MSTAEKVIAIIAKQLKRDPSEFDLSTDLAEAGYESLDVIETIFELEEQFGIQIDTNFNSEDPNRFRTVGDVVSLVEEHLAKQGGA